MQRFRKVLKPGLKRGKWQQEEDETLATEVERYLNSKDGKPRWPKIALLIPGRTCKQCRERWKCNLDPSINRSSFTKEEDETILQFYAQFGSRWALMARNLPGRTENAIKSRCVFLTKSQQQGEQVALQVECEGLLPRLAHQEVVSEVAQPIPEVPQHQPLGETTLRKSPRFLPSTPSFHPDASEAPPLFEMISPPKFQYPSPPTSPSLLTSRLCWTGGNGLYDVPVSVAELDRFLQ
jgi:hypothetical protein